MASEGSVHISELVDALPRFTRYKMSLSVAAREAKTDRRHRRELMRKYGLTPRGSG